MPDIQSIANSCSAQVELNCPLSLLVTLVGLALLAWPRLNAWRKNRRTPRPPETS